jgi:hypothetical protein
MKTSSRGRSIFGKTSRGGAKSGIRRKRGIAANHTKAAEAIASTAREERLQFLETEALHWITRGYEVNVALGRLFTEMKLIVGHGRWERYFAEKFAPRGISLRTGQEFMRLAAIETESPKNADLAHFPEATDAQASEIKEATLKAQKKLSEARKQGPQQPPHKRRVRLAGIYRLPLWLTGQEKDDLDALRKTANWPAAEAELLAVLRRLFQRQEPASKSN